jgi:hypothetical protein
MKLNSIFESSLKNLEFEKCVKNRNQNIFKIARLGLKTPPKETPNKFYNV